MGVAISPLIPARAVSFQELSGKTLAVDGYNMLYQFLTTIRGPDGAPLTDSHGNVTSHLTGLFSRVANLLGKGIRLVFVFDGAMPDLKRRELDRRRMVKEDAAAKYESAKEREDTGEMRKYAGRTSRLTREMVAQAKELLDALGVPWIDAPSEGEAQAAALVAQGHAWAVVSQDADALLYAAPRIIKNLAISGRRKLPGKLAYASVEPELIEHKDVLAQLKLDLAQLRVLAVLIGTDYNPGGVKGIGPKKGLKLVQECGHDFDAVFAASGWEEEISWKDVLRVFEEMPVVDPGKIAFGRADDAKVRALLIGRHDFSPERIDAAMGKLLKEQGAAQKGLSEFF